MPTCCSGPPLRLRCTQRITRALLVPLLAPGISLQAPHSPGLCRGTALLSSYGGGSGFSSCGAGKRLLLWRGAPNRHGSPAHYAALFFFTWVPSWDRGLLGTSATTAGLSLPHGSPASTEHTCLFWLRHRPRPRQAKATPDFRVALAAARQ